MTPAEQFRRWFDGLITRYVLPGNYPTQVQLYGLQWALTRERVPFYGVRGGHEGMHAGGGKTNQFLYLILCDKAFSPAPKHPDDRLLKHFELNSARFRDFAFDHTKKSLADIHIHRRTLLVLSESLKNVWIDRIKTAFFPTAFTTQNLTAKSKVDLKADILIITPDLLSRLYIDRDVSRQGELSWKKLIKAGIHRLAIDEAHLFKTQTTQHPQAISMVPATCKWVITATLMTKDYQDACSMYYMIGLEHPVMRSWHKDNFTRALEKNRRAGLTPAFLSNIVNVLSRERRDGDSASEKELDAIKATMKLICVAPTMGPMTEALKNEDHWELQRSKDTQFLSDASCLTGKEIGDFLANQLSRPGFKSHAAEVENLRMLTRSTSSWAKRWYVRFCIFSHLHEMPDLEILTQIAEAVKPASESPSSPPITLACFLELENRLIRLRTFLLEVVNYKPSVEEPSGVARKRKRDTGGADGQDNFHGEDRSLPAAKRVPRPLPGIMTFIRTFVPSSFEQTIYEEIQEHCVAFRQMSKEAATEFFTKVFPPVASSTIAADGAKKRDGAAHILRCATYMRFATFHPDLIRATRNDGSVDYLRRVLQATRRNASDCSLVKYADTFPMETADRHVAWLESAHTRLLSTKMRMIVEYLRTSVAPDEKVVIFANTQGQLHMMHGLIRDVVQVPSIIVMAPSSDKHWAEKKQRFKESSAAELKVGIFAARTHIQGLDLPEANHVLIVDPWYHSQDDYQAANRIQRIGQTRDTHACMFLVNNTIDVDIYVLAAETGQTNSTVSSTAPIRKDAIFIGDHAVPVDRTVVQDSDFEISSAKSITRRLTQSPFLANYNIANSNVHRRTEEVMNVRIAHEDDLRQIATLLFKPTR